MSKLLVCTRADENIRELTDITFPSIRAYAERCGADFKVLDAPSACPVGDGRWHYRILFLRELLDHYDRILHIDADVLITKDCPNLFEIVPQDHIGTIFEDKGSRLENRRRLIRCVQDVFGDVGWTEGYINTGVFLVSRQHEDIFAGMPTVQEGVDTSQMPTDLEPGHVVEHFDNGWYWVGHGWDDVHLGYMIRKRGHPIHKLPYWFNHMSMFSEPWNGSADRFKSFIIHYAGQGGFPVPEGESVKNKLDLLRHDAEKLGLLKSETSTDESRVLCLVGVFDHPDSTNIKMAEALEELGYRVVRISYREIIDAHGIDVLHERMQAVAPTVDAMIICKGFGGERPPIDSNVVKELPCKTVYWFMDSVDLAGETAVQLATACDVQCATSKVSCEAFARAGCQRVHQIFEGVDIDHWRPLDVEKKFDVWFKGTLDDSRKRLLQTMVEAGIRVSSAKGWVNNEDMVVFYNQSKIVLNPTWGEIFSQRAFHVAASGAFLLSGDCQDLRKVFTPGENCDVFRTPEEAVEKARYWLAHDQQREEAAAKARAVAEQFTWHNQMRKLVSAIENPDTPIVDGAFSPTVNEPPKPQQQNQIIYAQPRRKPRIALVSANMCIRATQTGLAVQKFGYDVHVVVKADAALRQFNGKFKGVHVFFNRDQCYETLRRLEPDLIHVHDRPHQVAADIIREQFGVPVVNDVHDMDSFLNMPIGSPLAEVYALEAADALVFVSEGYKKAAEYWYKHLPPSIVVPSMVCEHLMPDKRKPHIGAAVWEGGLWKHDEGDPRHYIDQRKIARKLLDQGIGVVFHPAPTTQENIDAYTATGAMVYRTMPFAPLIETLTRYDFGWYGQTENAEQIHITLPNKLFDYIAAGIPVLVINAREAARFVEDNGVGVAIQRPEDASFVLDKLKAIRETLWERRKLFTRERAVRPLLELYETLLRKQGAKAA